MQFYPDSISVKNTLFISIVRLWEIENARKLPKIGQTVFWWIGVRKNTSRYYTRPPPIRQRKAYGANGFFWKNKIFKTEISKFKKSKIENFQKNQVFCHIRAYASAWKTKNRVYFQMCDATECWIMPFKPIFSPVERFSLRWRIVLGRNDFKPL